MSKTQKTGNKPDIQIVCEIEKGLVLGLANILETEGHDDTLPYRADIYFYQSPAPWQKVGIIWNDGWGGNSSIRFNDPDSGSALVQRAEAACNKHVMTFMDESFNYEFKFLCDCIAAMYLDCVEEKRLPKSSQILVYRFEDEKAVEKNNTNLFAINKEQLGLDNLMIDIYARTYRYVVGNSQCKGTEYFHDREMTRLFCRNPYKAIRKTQVVTIDGWKYLAHYVKQN